MSAVNITGAVPGYPSTATAMPATQALQSSQSATVDYNQFLQLLVAEMRNQDPTSPTDPTEHISQLASFSAVEQQIKTNTSLSSLLMAEANQIIGKTVKSADGGTSGIVASVSISTDNRILATLQDGTSLSLDSGTTISSS